MEFMASEAEDRSFVEFRRKVRSSELLSAAIEKPLSSIRFTGRLTSKIAEFPPPIRKPRVVVVAVNSVDEIEACCRFCRSAGTRRSPNTATASDATRHTARNTSTPLGGADRDLRRRGERMTAAAIATLAAQMDAREAEFDLWPWDDGANADLWMYRHPHARR